MEHYAFNTLPQILKESLQTADDNKVFNFFLFTVSVNMYWLK